MPAARPHRDQPLIFGERPRAITACVAAWDARGEPAALAGRSKIVGIVSAAAAIAIGTSRFTRCTGR